MGESHRASHTRTGYLLGVVMLSAAVLLLGTTSLRHVFAEILGVWRSSTGSTLVEDIGGAGRRRSVVRSGRYVVALVGLVALAVGLAWELQTVLDMVERSMSGGVVPASILREDGTPALAALLVGLGLLPFVTFDERLVDAASREGFAVIVPGTR